MNAVTKATDSLLKIKNNLAQTTQKELKSELEKVILVCTDALALSAYSHEVTEQTRRDAMAYKFTPEQRGLCHNVPNDSKLLFGDDLNKRLTDTTTKLKKVESCKSKNGNTFSKYPKNGRNKGAQKGNKKKSKKSSKKSQKDE